MTGSQTHRDPRYLPYAFTEHGAIMAANVLNSSQATPMSIFVVRAFVKMRAVFNDRRDLAQQLALLEQELKIRLNKHEAALVDVRQRMMKILDPPPEPPPTGDRIPCQGGGCPLPGPAQGCEVIGCEWNTTSPSPATSSSPQSSSIPTLGSVKSSPSAARGTHCPQPPRTSEATTGFWQPAKTKPVIEAAARSMLRKFMRLTFCNTDWR